MWVSCQKMSETHIQWSPSITDTTGTKDFVLYINKVSLAQGVIVDHAPRTIVASYAELEQDYGP